MSKEKATQRINNNNNRTTGTAAPVTIIFGIIFLIAVVGVIFWFLSKKEVDTESVNVVITPDNVEEVIENIPEEQKTPVGSYEVNMNNKWTFTDGTSASEDAYVGNSENNRNTVYFTISPENSDEILYTSPYIPVGSHVDNIVLEKDLDAGIYNTVLRFHLLDDAYNELSTVAVGLTITIEN